MAQTGDRQQGDHRAVMGKGIHPAAGHGGHAMQYLKRNIGRVGGGNKRVGHGREGNAHPAGRRTGDPC